MHCQNTFLCHLVHGGEAAAGGGPNNDGVCASLEDDDPGVVHRLAHQVKLGDAGAGDASHAGSRLYRNADLHRLLGHRVPQHLLGGLHQVQGAVTDIFHWVVSLQEERAFIEDVGD